MENELTNMKYEAVRLCLGFTKTLLEIFIIIFASEFIYNIHTAHALKIASLTLHEECTNIWGTKN